MGKLFGWNILRICVVETFAVFVTFAGRKQQGSATGFVWILNIKAKGIDKPNYHG